MGLPCLIILVVILIGMWKVFVKAGQPGWGCIIPIFNLYCLVKIAGKPWWWLLLLFIPVVDIVIAVLIPIGVSRNFGKAIFLRSACCFCRSFFTQSSGTGMPRIEEHRLRPQPLH